MDDHQTTTLIFLDGPKDTLEFTLDGVNSRCDTRFDGFKNVPMGIHFISYRTLSRTEDTGEGPLTTLILMADDSSPLNLIVFKWSAFDEQFKFIQGERIASSAEAFDDRLLRYPGLADYKSFMQQVPEALNRWSRLTSLITTEILVVLLAELGVTNGVSIFEITPMTESHHSLLRLTDPSAPAPAPLPQLHFTKIPTLKDLMRSESPNGEFLTAIAHDQSLLLARFANTDRGIKDLIAEMQFCFIIFAFAQNFEGFEQWIAILNILCQSHSYAQAHSQEYDLHLFPLLQDHFSLCPSDYFTGFLQESRLYRLMWSLARSDLPQKDNFLVLQRLLNQKFGWEFVNTSESGDLEEFDPEDAPVIVSE